MINIIKLKAHAEDILQFAKSVGIINVSIHSPISDMRSDTEQSFLIDTQQKKVTSDALESLRAYIKDETGYTGSVEFINLDALKNNLASLSDEDPLKGRLQKTIQSKISLNELAEDPIEQQLEAKITSNVTNSAKRRKHTIFASAEQGEDVSFAEFYQKLSEHSFLSVFEQHPEYLDELKEKILGAQLLQKTQ